ncbi:MAG: T9SS type A sorting domain-containing protein [Bacteroidia bacterium]
MRSVLLFLVFISTGFSAKSQIWIGQLYEGQSINQVIYNGTYSATGVCSGQDYDFDLQYEMISPFATGIELMLEITSLGGTLTLNGNAVTEGNTYPLNEPVAPMLFQFTGSGSVDFSVHASGTPGVAAETYPCYVVDKVSQFACNNTYKLMEGEVFVPCTVATATGISEQELLQNIFFNQENQLLSVETKNADELIITDVLGRIILSEKLKKGKHTISLPQLSTGVYVARLESGNTILKFIKS